MNINNLQEMGLTKNEALVYRALLELGPSLAGQIARKTGMHRRSVYDTTEMLIQKGLIGYILRNNRRLFEANNPQRFLDLVKEKEEIANSFMGEMMALYGKTKEKQETNFYKGKQGLKFVFEEQIAEGKEILIIGASPLANEILQFYFHWFDKRRAEKRIKTRIIFNKIDKKIRIPLSEIRYMPKKYTSPLAVNIYGSKVVLIMWSKDNPFAIVIKQKEIADGYRNYFEMMWKVARK
jgi:sugar-specific transcriptional regulator TrmB